MSTVLIARRRRTAGGGGITDPTDIANCELWLAADNIVGLGDGDPVATWDDESGNNRDATQATSGNRPTYRTGVINSLPVIRFASASSQFFNLPDFLTGFSEGELFVVVKINNDPPGSDPATGFMHLGSDSTDSSHFPYTDGNVYDAFGTTSRKGTGNPTLSLASEFRLYNTISASGEWTSNIDGAQHYTTGTNTVGWNSSPKIGESKVASYSLNGDIAEIALFSRKLDSTERDNMEAYLSTKYALGL